MVVCTTSYAAARQRTQEESLSEELTAPRDLLVCLFLPSRRHTNCRLQFPSQVCSTRSPLAAPGRPAIGCQVASGHDGKTRKKNKKKIKKTEKKKKRSSICQPSTPGYTGYGRRCGAGSHPIRECSLVAHHGWMLWLSSFDNNSRPEATCMYISRRTISPSPPRMEAVQQSTLGARSSLKLPPREQARSSSV